MTRSPTAAVREQAAQLATCVVCLRVYKTGVDYDLLCEPCLRSYEKTDGGDMYSVVAWAAKRARRFARKS